MVNFTNARLLTLKLEAEDQINKLKKMDDDMVPDKEKLISILESLIILTERLIRKNEISRKSMQKKKRLNDVICGCNSHCQNS